MNLRNLSKSDRMDMLVANATKREQFSYFKQLTEDELAEKKEIYFREMAKIDAAKQELEKAKAEFKEATAIPNQIITENYAVIKNKGTTVTEDVYLITNHETGTVDYVNEDGETVFSRRILPAERQIMMKVSND